MTRYDRLVAVLVLLLGVAAVSIPAPVRGGEGGLVAGVHTIRADDGLLHQAVQGGFTWLVQLLEWREVEPVPGEHFWTYADWLSGRPSSAI